MDRAREASANRGAGLTHPSSQQDAPGLAFGSMQLNIFTDDQRKIMRSIFADETKTRERRVRRGTDPQHRGDRVSWYRRAQANAGVSSGRHGEPGPRLQNEGLRSGKDRPQLPCPRKSERQPETHPQEFVVGSHGVGAGQARGDARSGSFGLYHPQRRPRTSSAAAVPPKSLLFTQLQSCDGGHAS